MILNKDGVAGRVVRQEPLARLGDEVSRNARESAFLAASRLPLAALEVRAKDVVRHRRQFWDREQWRAALFGPQRDVTVLKAQAPLPVIAGNPINEGGVGFLVHPVASCGAHPRPCSVPRQLQVDLVGV